MIGVIAHREAGALFRSPVAWVVLATVQGLVAFIFLLHLESYLQMQPRLQMAEGGPGVTGFLVPRLFGAATMIYLMALPVLTMGLIAGDRRQGTLPLLRAAPVSTAGIVLGKYLGVLAVLALMVGLTVLMPVALRIVAPIDAGALALAALGALLFVAAAGAVGLYFSTITQQPAVAAVATLGVLLGTMLLGEWGRTAIGGRWGELLTYPAPATHLEPFLVGLFDSGAVAYFALCTALFLALAIRHLDHERLQP